MNMLREYLDFAQILAFSAGSIALEHWGNAVATKKPDGSDVTEVDRRIEKEMRRMIIHRYPRHDILGEELGKTTGGDGVHQWILDPIDGTSWYSMGAPLFGTLVALLEHGEPVLGVIHMPALHQTIFAAKGMGCWLQDGRIAPTQVHVRSPVPLAEAFVTASGMHRTDLESPPAEGWPLGAVVQGAGKFKFYGDCVQHALVCRGATHAAIDTHMLPWDIAALVPCIEEAGGVVTSLEGNRRRVVWEGDLLSTCHHSLQKEILGLLSPGQRQEPVVEKSISQNCLP